jgi:hypothetical protein
MKSVAGVAIVGSLLVGSLASANASCEAVLREKQKTIFDIKNDQINSGIKDNFKLTLSSIYQGIETQYGPIFIKPYTVPNFDLKKLEAETLKRANSLETSNDRYYLISDFMSSFNDAHISVDLPSTLTAKLPLQLQMADNGANSRGKICAGWLSDNYPKNVRRPDFGDELLLVNGVTPEFFQKMFPQMNNTGNDMTNATFFGFKLGSLSEESGLPVSKLAVPMGTSGLPGAKYLPTTGDIGSNSQMHGMHLTFRSIKNPTDVYSIDLDYKVEGVGLIGKDLDGNETSPPLVAGPIEVNVQKKNDLALKLAPKTTAIIRKASKLFRTEVIGIKKEAEREAAIQDKGTGRKMQIGALKPFFNLPRGFKELNVPDFSQAIKSLPEGSPLKTLLKSDIIDQFVSSEDFYAGTFVRGGKTVGFLRIPSYEPDSEATIAATIRYYIGHLEATTDYLVIDQTNNPGGMVIMTDMLMKALNGGKINRDKHMRFAVRPSQGFLREYADMMRDIAKNEDGLLNANELKSILTDLNEQYMKIYAAYESNQKTGRHELSEPISMVAISEYTEKAFDNALFQANFGPLLKQLLGVDVSQPQAYTKPIYFMINELDFSGGDATPAIFQDYGRGKLVGTRTNGRTAGAGGTVEEFSFRSTVELIIRWTTSLMVRAQGNLVENYGVRADINVPWTQQDIANSGKTYFTRVLQAIDKDMAQKNKK